MLLFFIYPFAPPDVFLNMFLYLQYISTMHFVLLVEVMKVDSFKNSLQVIGLDVRSSMEWAMRRDFLATNTISVITKKRVDTRTARMTIIIFARSPDPILLVMETSPVGRIMRAPIFVEVHGRKGNTVWQFYFRFLQGESCSVILFNGG